MHVLSHRTYYNISHDDTIMRTDPKLPVISERSKNGISKKLSKDDLR